jgi:hypothetical protein
MRGTGNQGWIPTILSILHKDAAQDSEDLQQKVPNSGDKELCPSNNATVLSAPVTPLKIATERKVIDHSEGCAFVISNDDTF